MTPFSSMRFTKGQCLGLSTAGRATQLAIERPLVWPNCAERASVTQAWSRPDRK
jgi:hypothetical protein